MTKQELVQAVRAHAIANYNKGGWDFLVECWEDSDIEALIGNSKLIEQLDDEISMIEVDPAEWAAQQIKDRKRMRAKMFWLAQQQSEEENEIQA